MQLAVQFDHGADNLPLLKIYQGQPADLGKLDRNAWALDRSFIFVEGHF